MHFDIILFKLLSPRPIKNTKNKCVFYLCLFLLNYTFLYRSEFLNSVIFLLTKKSQHNKNLKPFLNIFCEVSLLATNSTLFFWESISPSILKNKFIVYTIVTFFFCQHLKYIILSLLSCMVSEELGVTLISGFF